MAGKEKGWEREGKRRGEGKGEKGKDGGRKGKDGGGKGKDDRGNGKHGTVHEMGRKGKEGR